ncbi:MAG: putative membrane protein [Myxococcota bacterium]|jgi:putative membrane protein
MMTLNIRRRPLGIIQWQLRNILYYGVAGTFAWALIEPLGFKFLELPVMPVTIVGAAIGIFASFRANQAYDRWWEGRKLWGRMINSSRHWCTQITHYLGESDKELAEVLVLRQVSYVHALRCLLRGEDPFADADYQRFGESDDAIRASTNLTHALLDRQFDALVPLNNAGRLDGHRLESLDRSVLDFLNIQGGCERIKGTPLPRGVGFIVELLIQTFALMLPFAMVHELGWVAIPLNMLVCLAFALISEAGRVLEDPFSMFWNGLPLNALSIKIEQNLRQRLGHTDLPPTVQENPPGVLM